MYEVVDSTTHSTLPIRNIVVVQPFVAHRLHSPTHSIHTSPAHCRCDRHVELVVCRMWRRVRIAQAQYCNQIPRRTFERAIMHARAPLCSRPRLDRDVELGGKRTVVRRTCAGEAVSQVESSESSIRNVTSYHYKLFQLTWPRGQSLYTPAAVRATMALCPLARLTLPDNQGRVWLCSHAAHTTCATLLHI